MWWFLSGSTRVFRSVSPAFHFLRNHQRSGVWKLHKGTLTIKLVFNQADSLVVMHRMVLYPRNIIGLCPDSNSPQLHQEITVNENAPESQRSTFVKQLKLGKVGLHLCRPRILKAQLRYCGHILSLSFSFPSVFASIYKDWHGPAKEPWKDRSTCSSRSICQWTATNTTLSHRGSNVLQIPLRLKIQAILQENKLSTAPVCGKFSASFCSLSSRQRLYFMHALAAFCFPGDHQNNNKSFINGTCSSVFFHSSGMNPQLSLTYDCRWDTYFMFDDQKRGGPGNIYFIKGFYFEKPAFENKRSLLCSFGLPVSRSPSQYLFQLTAVLVHHGDMHSGHFVTYRRSPSPPHLAFSAQWLWVSDDSVRKASLHEVLSSNAYMLFYERVQRLNLSLHAEE